MSVQLLSMALAPLLGLFIMSISSALMSSLTTLRLDAMGFSATMVGVVSSAYFIAARDRFTRLAICCADCTARGSNSSARLGVAIGVLQGEAIPAARIQ